MSAAVAGTSDGTLAAAGYASGTFTVVNLGMYGVKSAAPIVTAPQAAVLALGAIEERVLPSEDPEEVYRLAQVLTATCSFDHRVVDGAVGAQWLAAFKKLAENPLTMLL
jgi:pyruvate dehydrogenase E2 component (dihydrolipoamide acetyltransferase)